jgi:hypothetical protein
MHLGVSTPLLPLVTIGDIILMVQIHPQPFNWL